MSANSDLLTYRLSLSFACFLCLTHTYARHILSLSLSFATSVSHTNVLSLSLSNTNTRTHRHTHKHSHTQSHTHAYTHIHTNTSIIGIHRSTQRHMIESMVDSRLQGAENAQDALRCTSLSPKTTLIIGLFCGKSLFFIGGIQ